jgi:alanyl-tRNA synthetase
MKMEHKLIPKRDAEEMYGFRLYQGGAVPGREIRVVNIPGFDVEACGGTHLNNTAEAGLIKILKSSKIQDGIVRIEYVAGEQAKKLVAERQARLEELKSLLGVNEKQLPAAAEFLFQQWKKARKGQPLDNKPSFAEYNGDALIRTAEILQTQQENLIPTVKRFQNDIQTAQGK